MKKLIVTCVILLAYATVSVNATPLVIPPPDAPSWWNEECTYYAYGWWEEDIFPGNPTTSPPNNAYHWSSNFLSNTDFTASVSGNVITINLLNEYQPNLYKEVYIYLEGITTLTEPGISITGDLDADGGTFTGDQISSIDNNQWHYIVDGEIHPQPAYVILTVTVPELVNVTNIWAGENCIPEPTTIALLSLGTLSLMIRKNKQ